MHSSYPALEMRETDTLEQPEPIISNHFSDKNLVIARKWAVPLLVPILVIITLSCTDLSEYDEAQVRSTMHDSLIYTTESWDVEMVLMQEGSTRMLIEGSYAISYQQEENKQTKIDGPVYVQIYDSLGTVETEAWSERAVYLEKDGEFELFDSVRVQTHDDRFLYSNYLKWAQDTDRITSPYYVTIITPTDSISGRGFDGLTDLSSYTITEPRGRLIVD
jgi:LPS export ABC transporter protein LptC